jgi:sorbose reductase
MAMAMNVLDLFDLRGKRALVTGASSGIGKKVAQAYLQAGADVAIAARNIEALQNTADELAAHGPPGAEGNVVPIRCDVTRPEQVSAMLDRAVGELGGIDIAVCNAGVIAMHGMLDMSPDEFQRIQNTNVTGVFLTAQAAARAMVKQGKGGVIITTASMSGHIINTPQQVGHYCTSKAAVIHLTKAMAVEFAPHNIRVNSVSPGYIRTELVEPLSEYHAQWEPKIPLGRMGRPEELTGLYLYLASAASSYMTGSDIVIDGGYTCP